MDRLPSRLVLAIALVASMVVFFVTLGVVFRGHIPHVSQRTSVTTRQLEMSLAPVNEELTRIEGSAREYVERLEPARFMKRAALPPPPPPAPPAKKTKAGSKTKAPTPPRVTPVAPLPKWDGNLPSGAKGILITDTSGLAVLVGGETGRIKSEGELKGFFQDTTGKYLILALPHQKGGQWLGTVQLFYDWAGLLEKLALRTRFEPVAKAVWVTHEGTAIISALDEKIEGALLDRLDERLKTYRSAKGRSYFEKENRSLVWATLSPFPLRLAVWYPDSSLGVPGVSLALLAILLLLIAILFYVNYLVLQREEVGESEEQEGVPTRHRVSKEKWIDTGDEGETGLTDPQADSKWQQVEAAHRASVELERELLESPRPTIPTPQPAPSLAPVFSSPRPSTSAFSALDDLPELPQAEDPVAQTDISDFDLPEGDGTVEEEGGDLPEIPESVYRGAHAADPRISNLIESMEDEGNGTPVPKFQAQGARETAPVEEKTQKPQKKAIPPRKKRVPPSKMTLKDFAEAIQKRNGIWSTSKRITADLINKWPKLGEGPLAVLIDNGESHVVFQDEGMSSATRGRLVIPHDHPFWMKFLSRGRILHVAENPGASDLLRRWFAPADLARMAEVVFVPVFRKKEGWFVVCATRPKAA